MSNNIKQDLKNNNVFDLLNGSAPQPINEIQQVKNIDVKPIKDNEIIKPIVSEVKPKANKKVVSDATITKDNYKYKDKTPNKNGQLSKDKNYTITFKIDADIEQYLKNIDKITFIESLTKGDEPQGKDATTYVNDLIRADLKKMLKIADNDDDFNKWVNGYKEYATKHNIKDK